MQLRISYKVLEKLKLKHGVNKYEIEECFLNQTRVFLEDLRAKHITIPPTFWFISTTDRSRLLKIVFIELLERFYEIKTAYEPNAEEKRIYEKYAQTIQ